MAKKPKAPEGVPEFADLLGKLAHVPKAQLDAEVRKHESRRIAKKAKAAKKPPRPSR